MEASAFDPNFATLFEAVAALDPGAHAMVQGDRRIAWGEFDETAARLATALATWGVAEGDRVALYLYNCPEYLELAFAAFKLRSLPVNINFRYRSAEVAYLLDDSDAKVLVFHGALASEIAALGDRTARLGALVQVDDGSAPLVAGAVWYHDVVAAHRPAAPIERDGGDHLILYTGGTTGMPKGVVWRHGDLFRSLTIPTYAAAGIDPPTTAEGVAAAAMKLRGAGISPVMVSCPPLIHGTALFLAMTAFVRGGEVVLLSSRHFEPGEVWDLVERERVTDLAIVGDPFAQPLVAELEAREAAGRPVDLSSLRMVSSAGITWSASTKRALRARGSMVLLDMLGASEGGPFATSITPAGADPGDTATFTIVERAAVLDDDGHVLPAGTERVGRLAVKGDGPIGYFRDEAKTAGTFLVIDGERYIVPGDYARVAADGTMTFIGRGSGCINSGGEKIYPEEVEQALKEHPHVTDCYVVGVPDPRYGAAVAAVVELEVDTSDEDLVAHVRARLAAYKQPRHIVRVDALVRSPTGKSDYRWARRAALDALGLQAGAS